VATKYHVGCSGWSYKHWRNDFYPKGLPASKWFDHYAGVFDTVELNNSFYRLPSEAAVEGWQERSPDGFCFSVKVSRLITHFRRLRNSEEALDTYLKRMRPLGEKLGPLLYQLPPDFERDDERLEAFLRLLPSDLSHVFEFRHRSWWTDDVWALLEKYDAAFCVYHSGDVETPVLATSDVFYMRFHGTRYSGSYDDSELRRWAARIRETARGEAWLYFNNDIGGHAPRDAIRLRDLLDVRSE
jgi:uncharacterized protein YecE (DUF72 family)